MSTGVASYNPQSPTPHSPPRTPTSPTSFFPTASHQSTIPLDTPATTPDSHLPIYPSIDLSQSRRNSERSVLSGMGITFPPESNPLPAELSEGATTKSGGSIELAKSASEGPHETAPSMAPTWSNGGVYTQPGFAQNPTRSHSPAQFDAQNGFASSSSYRAGAGLEHRDRVTSPTKPEFDAGSNEQLPSLNLDTSGVPGALLESNSSPLWSPAIDGKKEPSIRPPPYDPNAYAHPGAKNRSRSPYPAAGFANEKSDGGHPLTSQAYNHPTTRENTTKEGFYDSAAYWLCLYFFFNLGLTLFNKIVLVSFPFPYTLTGLHALSGCAGTYLALEQGAFVPARLTQRESLILGAFSILYTINIAVSNISLQLVTVPFHQVVRASTPLFTIIISSVILRTRFSLMKLVSLLPVVAGVGFATYGDYYFTAWGLILTLLGTFLAALKTVITNLIQTGSGQRLKLHPLDLLMRMSPLAFIQCVVYGWYTGELDRVRRYGATQMTRGKAIALLVNGVIACGLNIVSFTANKKAGALTMTVSANCKQVLTIALAVLMFDLHISPTNGIGILLTLIGGGWYGYVEYTEKQKKSMKLVDRS